MAILDKSKEKLEQASAATLEALNGTRDKVGSATASASEVVDAGIAASTQKAADLADATSAHASRLATATQNSGKTAGKKIQQIGKQLSATAKDLRSTDPEAVRAAVGTTARDHRGLIGVLFGLAVGLLLGRRRA